MNNTHRPCLMLSLIFACGIVLGKWVVVPIWIWLVIAVAILAVYIWNRGLVMVYVLFFALGAAWITQRGLLPQDSLAFLSYKDAIRVEAVDGIVLSQEDMTVDVREILINGLPRKTSGVVKLKVWGKREFNIDYGAQVRIMGKMYPIHDMRQGSFSYRRYLQERGIFWMFAPQKNGVEVIAVNKGNIIMASAGYLRSRINEVFYHYLSTREAAFVSALVIGDRRNMPKDLKEIFVNTGTAHILAISGMNMAVIVTVLFFAFQLTWLTRRWKFIMTVLFLFVYAYISGWSASVVRATIMSAVLLSSFAFEYEGDALNSLGIAALILLFLDPNNLFDVGFQLSFAAVAGILLLTQPIERVLKLFPRILALPIAVSIAAFLVTSGIMLYHFHIFTPVSILANLPIVPLADLVMGLGLGLVCVSFYQPIAIAFAATLKAVLSLMILFALWFSQVPFGNWHF